MKNEPSQNDRDLWQRFVQASELTLPESQIDPNTLASYLDGTADDSVIEAVEQAMAANPQVLECVIEMRQIQGAANDAAGHVVPHAVTAAAVGFVKQTREPQRHDVLSSRAWFWWQGLQRVAAAVVVTTAGVSGYIAGTGTYQDEAVIGQSIAETVADLGDFQDESSLLLAMLGTGGAQ